MLFPLLTAILLHESGHILALILSGGRLRGITLSPLGITLRAEYPPSYAKMIAISLAGPATFLLPLLFAPRSLVCQISLVLSLFNLLPVFPLDGGMTLYYILCFFVTDTKAESTVRVFSLLVDLLLWLAASYLMLFLNGSPSLFFLSFWLLLSLRHSPEKKAFPHKYPPLS